MPQELGASHLWKGHVVRAVDGSKLTLARSKDITAEFPLPAPERSKKGVSAHYPSSLLVTACQVFTGQPTSARVSDMYGTERESLISMVKEDFSVGDICLLDRGFDGMKVWGAIEENGQYYIARLREVPETGAKHFQYVHEFLKTGKKETIIKRKSHDRESGKIIDLSIRLIRGRLLKNGTVLVIGTNLLDSKKYPAKDVLKLYSERWKVETMYSRVKTLLQVEKFHARQPNGILQEIFANLLVLSMTAALAHEVAKKKNLKIRKIAPNFKNASEVLKRNLFYNLGAISLTPAQRKQQVQQMIDQVVRVLCKKQPGRSYPRYSRQVANRWTYGRAHKLKAFQEGLRSNHGKDMRQKYAKLRKNA